jgi:hypothetical protein
MMEEGGGAAAGAVRSFGSLCPAPSIVNDNGSRPVFVVCDAAGRKRKYFFVYDAAVCDSMWTLYLGPVPGQTGQTSQRYDAGQCTGNGTRGTLIRQEAEQCCAGGKTKKECR